MSIALDTVQTPGQVDTHISDSVPVQVYLLILLLLFYSNASDVILQKSLLQKSLLQNCIFSLQNYIDSLQEWLLQKSLLQIYL